MGRGESDDAQNPPEDSSKNTDNHTSSTATKPFPMQNIHGTELGVLMQSHKAASEVTMGKGSIPSVSFTVLGQAWGVRAWNVLLLLGSYSSLL